MALAVVQVGGWVIFLEEVQDYHTTTYLRSGVGGLFEQCCAPCLLYCFFVDRTVDLSGW